MGLGQSQQVPLGGQDLPEPVAERRARIVLLSTEQQIAIAAMGSLCMA
jgi:hypothetical protein